MTLVTAVMPTAGTPERRPLALVAVECFHNQSHTDRQLLILNHGQSLELPPDPAVREIMVERPPTLGALRNLAFDHLEVGTHMITWDDDDWHHPERITYQLAMCLNARVKAADLTAYITVDLLDGRSFVRSCKHFSCRSCGGTVLCQVGPDRYPLLERREDVEFVKMLRREGQCLACKNRPVLYVRTCHTTNTTDRNQIMNSKGGRRELTGIERVVLEQALEAYRRHQVIPSAE